MKRIDEIWMVIAENEKEGEEGSEGIVSGRVGPRVLPLMVSAGTEQRIATLRLAAHGTANESGQTLRIVKFTRAEVVETITPEPKVFVACPICGTEAPRDHRVSAGDASRTSVSLCVKCRSICKYSEDFSTLILMTDDEIAELPAEFRSDLARARSLLRRLDE